MEPINILDLENMKEVTVSVSDPTNTLAEDINKNIRITLLAEIIIVFVTVIVMSLAHNGEIKAQNEMIKQLTELQSQNNTEIQDLKEQLVVMSENKAAIRDLQDDVANLKITDERIKEYEFQIEMTALDKIEDKEEWFIEYKRITDKYRDYIDPPETIYDVYSQEEITWLCRMIESETTGCPFECRVHVADVAFNRIEAEEWPDTLLNVITQSDQFSTRATNITETTRLAAEYAFLFPGSARGALSFHSNAKSDTFNGYGYIFSDTAVHHFYGRE